MSAGGLSETRLDTLHDVMSSYVERRVVPGLTALVARGADVHVEVLGTSALDDPTPLRRGTPSFASRRSRSRSPPPARWPW